MLLNLFQFFLVSLYFFRKKLPCGLEPPFLAPTGSCKKLAHLNVVNPNHHEPSTIWVVIHPHMISCHRVTQLSQLWLDYPQLSPTIPVVAGLPPTIPLDYPAGLSRWTIPNYPACGWTIPNYPQLSQLWLDYPQLSRWTIPNYPSCGWTIPNYPAGLSPTIPVVAGLSPTIPVVAGLSPTIPSSPSFGIGIPHSLRPHPSAAHPLALRAASKDLVKVAGLDVLTATKR